MCGITGIFNLDGRPVPVALIKKMNDIISYRGPDDEGIYAEGNFGLGHRRLSVLDPSPLGSQPMISKDGNWVVAFNGCIYDFIEHRIKLKALGHSFISNSDTEVITEGVAEFGPSFFERLDGMFAIAAWNKKHRKLYLSRDRYGIKPLYYWFNGSSLVFASEIKAITTHSDFRVDLNYEALNEYFTFQNLFRYHTLFKNIYLLPPANTIEICKSTRSVQHAVWWDYNFSDPDEKMTFQEAKSETKRLMENAVTKQVISDVPVGSYLSGGMDSGSITCLASKHIPRMPTFTAGFDMSDVTGFEANYDERRDAELMANHFKTEHYEQVINAGDLRWSLPKVVWHIEDLRLGMSYPNYYISRLASKFVKVCLQGTGGDELYGGYPWRYYRVFDSLDQQSYFKNYYAFWQRLVRDKLKKDLFTPQVLSNIDQNEPRKVFERVFTFNDKLSFDTPEHQIQNSLYFEIKTFLHGLLIVGDRLSMANGLEERFPFLDNELVTFAQKIPVRHKLANLEQMKRINENKLRQKQNAYQEFNDGKNVLRKAMAELIPAQIINRKKQGFSAPDESWYRGENAAYIEELLLNHKSASSEFINRKFVKRIVNEHINKGINHRLLIWSFMSFEWWCRIFLKGEKVVS